MSKVTGIRFPNDVTTFIESEQKANELAFTIMDKIKALA